MIPARAVRSVLTASLRLSVTALGVPVLAVAVPAPAAWGSPTLWIGSATNSATAS
jgi:hypothetical protein